MQALLLLLILVPSPKAAPDPPSPIVGVWSIDWGTNWNCPIRQTTFFYPDGRCWSPEFNGGVWSIDSEGSIWFSEQDGRNPYVMRVDLLEGTGTVWRIGDDGQIRHAAELGIRRGEYLKVMPRVVE